jgi:hypothetical protein
MSIHNKTFKEEIMEDFLRRMIEEKMNEELEKDTEFVGELPQHLSDKLRVVKNESEHFDEDLELKKRQYALEVKRKLEAEFDSRYEEYKKEHIAVWNEIYRTMNVDPNGCYYHRNGKLFVEKSSHETDSDWSRKETDFTRPFRS